MMRVLPAAGVMAALLSTTVLAQRATVLPPTLPPTLQPTLPMTRATTQPATQPATPAAAQRGNELYQYWCATCHGRGPGQPGTTALAAKYKGALPGLLEERTDLSPQTIRFAVRRGTSIMPFFRKTEISDADLDAIAQHLARKPAAQP